MSMESKGKYNFIHVTVPYDKGLGTSSHVLEETPGGVPYFFCLFLYSQNVLLPLPFGKKPILVLI